MSGWDIATGVLVFAGALLALIGSFAQALGDLGKYRTFRKDAAGTTAAAEPVPAAATEPGPADEREAIPPGGQHGFLPRQAGKLLSKEKVRNFLAEENLHGVKLVGQVVSLILIAGWQPVKVAGKEHELAEQALNDAAGWSLILLGAALALAAGVIQVVLTLVRAL